MIIHDKSAAHIFALLSYSAHWVYSMNAASGISGSHDDIYNDTKYSTGAWLRILFVLIFPGQLQFYGV